MVKKPRHPVGESLILSRLSGRRCGVGERFEKRISSRSSLGDHAQWHYTGCLESSSVVMMTSKYTKYLWAEGWEGLFER